MTTEEIIDGNKLIAEFMGFIYPYKCNISRGGGVMDNVDLLSKIKFMTLPELLESDINNEAAPYYNNESICIGKYSGERFYDNIVFFSTDSTLVPVTIDYNIRVQAYHSSWDWLMPVVEKIENMVNSNNVVVNLLLGRNSCVINPHVYPEVMLCEYDKNKQIAIWKTIVSFIKWYNTNKL